MTKQKYDDSEYTESVAEISNFQYIDTFQYIETLHIDMFQYIESYLFLQRTLTVHQLNC